MKSHFEPNASLKGRTAIITGASRGIGQAIATRLHQAGARVVLCGRSRQDLQQITAELGSGAFCNAFDITDRAAGDSAVREMADWLGGRIDILVNNAGANADTPLAQSEDALWNTVLATNLSAPMYLTRAALPYFKAGASVINISSVLGKMGVPFKGAYCAAKHGIIGWTRAVALELAPQQIRVNVVCPGWTETAMAQQSIADAAKHEEMTAAAWRTRAESLIPQKRFLQTAEVAELVAFLGSTASAGITAEVFTISAGATPF